MSEYAHPRMVRMAEPMRPCSAGERSELYTAGRAAARGAALLTCLRIVRTSGTSVKACRISARLVLSALVLCSVLLDLAHGAQSSRSTSKQSEALNDDVLLNAINFALTGTDGIRYAFTDRPECVVTKAQPSAQQGIQAIEIFHLNNIDASRIVLQKMQSKSDFGVSR